MIDFVDYKNCVEILGFFLEWFFLFQTDRKLGLSIEIVKSLYV